MTEIKIPFTKTKIGTILANEINRLKRELGDIEVQKNNPQQSKKYQFPYLWVFEGIVVLSLLVALFFFLGQRTRPWQDS